MISWGGLQSVRSGPRKRRQGVSPPEDQVPQTRGPRPPGRGGTPPGGGGCSSYQRLSKFAGISGTPILKSGLRGTAKKTPQRRVCDETPQKRVKNACILGFFGHFWGFFGHFWPFLAIFGHFWTFLTPPGVSVEGPPQLIF